MQLIHRANDWTGIGGRGGGVRDKEGNERDTIDKKDGVYDRKSILPRRTPLEHSCALCCSAMCGRIASRYSLLGMGL